VTETTHPHDQLEELLMASALRGGTVFDADTVAGLLAKAFGADVRIIEGTTRVLAQAPVRGGNLAEYPSMPPSAPASPVRMLAPTTRTEGHDATTTGDRSPSERTLRELIDRSRTDRDIVIHHGRTGVSYVSALVTGERFHGALTLTVTDELTADARRWLQRAVRVVSLLWLHHHASAEAELRVRGELIDELLGSRKPMSEVMRSFAASRHFDVSRPHTVLAVGVPPELHTSARRAVSDVARNHGGVGGEQSGDLIMIVPSTGPRTSAETIRRRLRQLLSCPVVVCASPAVDPAAGELASAFESARRCLPLLASLNQLDVATTTQDLALYSLLFDSSRADDLQQLVTGALGPLLTYDQLHGSDLLHTVRVFFACGGNATQAARHLFVHLNTMAKRLDRVAQVLGEDWQTEQRSLPLRLALHLYDLADASRQSLDIAATG